MDSTTISILSGVIGGVISLATLFIKNQRDKTTDTIALYKDMNEKKDKKISELEEKVDDLEKQVHELTLQFSLYKIKAGDES